jgi:hypothetical protein
LATPMCCRSSLLDRRCFIVRDAKGRALVCVYFEDTSATVEESMREALLFVMAWGRPRRRTRRREVALRHSLDKRVAAVGRCSSAARSRPNGRGDERYCGQNGSRRAISLAFTAAGFLARLPP